uniref:DM13 domain-containing protein n=1 Tax=Parastrongyloides trichosuri TaxID=131310 RepID=A0A0N4ZQN4_PARTI
MAKPVDNPPAADDSWSFQLIGTPFPDCPVKVLGQNNMYIALWYKNGKPIHGRAWNNGGVVECSFPYNKVELSGAKDLGGQIQVLQYKGDHNTLGFFYEWIKYKDRFMEVHGNKQILHCGDSIPIYDKGRQILGYLDNKTEIAKFSKDNKVYESSGGDLGEMYIIVRNCKGGPLGCECTKCYVAPEPPKPTPTPQPLPPRILIDEWMDIKANDPFPTRNIVKALNRSLDTMPGVNGDQYVALYYIQGEPIMGRAFNDNGKIQASFGWFGNEYSNKVGSMQLLVRLNENLVGYTYHWKPFREINVYGVEQPYQPVHVEYYKGNISPCVLKINGKEILGKVDIRNEKASASLNGKEIVLSGPAIGDFLVLTRLAKEGYKLE